ncbi:hypothetical protein [Halanaerobacter jeridensis]|uniref:Phage late control gene D protein (GPD) n=1 Tax=Halanaerobacter jeridensis TaxID=706427 RepID=A0A938XST4_9FIRM|nr:hypothetical protein [Halanaerobacter jeridensis]MBM7556855.1 hypothetical protein [Halanaerobacter jeridensis]
MKEEKILNQGGVIVEEIEYEQLYNLRIKKGINKHDRLYISGLISDKQRDKYIKSTTVGNTITVKIKGTGAVVFKGLVEEIDLTTRKNNYFIKIYGLAETYNLDIKKKSFSFQETGISYKKLINKVLKSYSEVDFKDKASEGENKENLLVQYQETDWEFLKRIASRFNTGLVPDSSGEGIRFHFGVPKGRKTIKIEDTDYDVSKKLRTSQEIKENYQEGVKDKDFVDYTLQIRDVKKINALALGTKVQFSNQNLFVKDIALEVKNGNLVGEYIMTKKKGLAQEEIINPNLIGLSILGQVLEVKQDQIKVHLEIDEEQSKSKAILFKYCTDYTSEGDTGFYTMPEKGDHVLLYVPDEYEKNAVITAAVRKEIKGSDKVSDPKIKYFRTKYGKEIAFKEKEIMITGEDEHVLIKINEEDGIELLSKHDVKINSKKKIKLDAKKAIEMKCKGSKIKLDGKVNVQGSEVTIN